MKLDKIFNPKTIAVIGASDTRGSVGKALMKNLIGAGFQGIVYPVNIKRKSVQSIKAYPSIKDVPDKIDLAIIAVPAKIVPSIVEECGQSGVGGIVIISAGFNEIGKEGEKLSQDIIKISRQYKMRVVGPNCLGFIRPKINLNASFARRMAKHGRIAFISQSGALCTSILDWANKNNVGFSHFVSVGSMIDVGFHDLIDYFGSDPNTSSILIYMESLTNARKFMSAARAFSKGKPIVVLKSGRTSAGAKAAMSHTGSIAGNDSVYDAAFERAGVIRVDTAVELFHVAKTLAMQPKPKGNNLAIVTNAGGPGVITVDALIKRGGKVAKLAKKSIKYLDKILPDAWSHGNPVDILGDATPERFKKSMEICLKDPNVHSVLAVLTPQYMTDPTAIARELVSLPRNGKTILATWMGGNDVAEGRRILEAGNIPIYRSPEDAIKCLMYINNYSNNLELLYETPSTIPHAFKPKTKKNKIIISNALKEGRSALTEMETKELLINYDIPVAKYNFAKNVKEAVSKSKKIGYPVVMKIMSDEIFHKTDIGGVVLNVESDKDAVKAYNLIIKNAKKNAPKAKIEGVFIEQMIKKRYELLLGSKKDDLFGPVIVFGMGGVAVEVFNDTKIGLPPLNMLLSLRMINDTKIHKLLDGYRNMPGVDIQAIQFLLYKFSYLVSDFPELKEVDINPFTVDEKGGIVLDAKAVLDTEIAKKEVKPYSHLVISPYPKEYIYDFTLKSRKKVLIRPIKPEDEPMESEMFTKFSKETERHRFFHQIKDITHEVLQRYTHIDYDREIALIAEINEKGKKKMIGVARLINDPYSESGEFAIVVADPWQYNRLGNKFTDLILDIAKKRGLKTVYAKFLKHNNPVISIFRKRGFNITIKGNKGYAELELK